MQPSEIHKNDDEPSTETFGRGQDVESTDESEESIDSTIIGQLPKQMRERKKVPTLVVIEGAEIGHNFPLRRPHTVIGRAPDADILVKSDTMISRRHASVDVVMDPITNRPQYKITDLESTNHTFRNGDEVSAQLLSDGDHIQTGETTFKFLFLDDIEARFHDQIRRRMHFDMLTGLLTKESCFLAIETELRRCAKRKLPLSVLMLDLDFFRKVNDRYGHQGGSAVLAQLGSVIEDHIRGFDLAARYGGEEFTVALPETPKPEAMPVAERLRKEIEAFPFEFDEQTIRITTSVGVSQYPEDGMTVKELVAEADRALYASKNNGRNRVTAA